MASRLACAIAGAHLLGLGTATDALAASSLPPHASAAEILAGDIVESAPAADQARAARQIVTSFTEAFIGQDISEAERQCLAKGAGNITSQILESCSAAVDTYHFATNPAPAARPAFGADNTSLGNVQPGFSWMPAEAPPQVMSEGQEAVFALEFGAKLATIADLEKFVAKDCLKTDAKKDLERASGHFGDMLFVGGRLIANGVDVLEDLSHASVAYKDKRFEDFGKDLGGAWRKVLLTRRVDLQIPSQQAIVEVTRGLMESLFADDLSLHIVADSPAGALLPASPQLRGGGSPMGAAQNGSPFQTATQPTEAVLDV
eukprot:TRINITY_DN467_c3_g1_i1.p1 TRINITY_DN467_c3_g1~~TRINITY_DN467_c3_g1_i1.p1  ORF type:complete len:347 (-),score=80.56 TRINITY_DN467_c3_g1_i1:166-1116(-)